MTAKTGNFVTYYRVSTDKQKRSGLGLAAQKAAVAVYLNGGDHPIVGEFTERESGKRNDRPELANALALCQLHNATLIVAKLDRLTRDTRFLLKVKDECGPGGVVFCDLPHIEDGATGRFILTQMAAVAELEAGLISQRTKAALKAAKARGQVLGCKNGNIARYASDGARASASVRSAKAKKRAGYVWPFIDAAKAAGAVSLRQIAAHLNGAGIPTVRGGEWSAVQVQRLLSR